MPTTRTARETLPNAKTALASQRDGFGSRHYWLALLLTVALVGAVPPSSAAESPPVSFEHHDWELRCDITRTCRAAGYQADGEWAASMLVSRAAGPNAPVQVQVIALTDVASPSSMTLSVGGQLIGELQGDPASVPARLVPDLLRQLLDAATATLQSGDWTWTLSLRGAKAVLLKMDEAQGRLGTPGAIVQRGDQPEASVLPPLPAPVIEAVKPLPSLPGDAELGRSIYSAFPASEHEVIHNECENGLAPAEDVTAFRLDARTLLISVPCTMGAYNSTSLLWVASDQAPYKPRAVEASGEFDPETGIVRSWMRARGEGDCGDTTVWQYDGEGFTLAGHSFSGMCRSFPGGAWWLPDYVTTTSIK